MADRVRARRRARGRRPGPRRGSGPLHRRHRPRHDGRRAAPRGHWTEFDFDSVLLPYNYPMSLNAAVHRRLRGAGWRSARSATWRSRRSSPSPARRGATGEQTANTWYEPLTDQDAIDTAVSWVLGRPGVFLNTVGDIHMLPKVLDAAERFTARPDEDEMARAGDLRAGTPVRLDRPWTGCSPGATLLSRTRSRRVPTDEPDHLPHVHLVGRLRCRARPKPRRPGSASAG